MRTELRRSLCHAGRVGRAGSGEPLGTASTAQIVQEAGVQAPELSSTGLETLSLATKGCTVNGEDYSCSVCVHAQLHKLHFKQDTPCSVVHR